MSRGEKRRRREQSGTQWCYNEHQVKASDSIADIC